jgi:hypothetical protein
VDIEPFEKKRKIDLEGVISIYGGSFKPNPGRKRAEGETRD